MRIAAGCVAWVILAGHAPAQENEAEKAVKQILKVQKKTLEVLKGIKDKESAVKAKAMLEELAKEHARAHEALEKAPQLKDPTDPFALVRVLTDLANTEDSSKINGEIERIAKDEAIREVMKDTGWMKSYLEGKEREARERTDRARKDVIQLTKALQVYWQYNRAYPKSLEILAKATVNKRSIVEGGVIDPWGKQYKYDPAGPMNKGKQPDIWSDGPPGGDKIGNWMK